MGTPALRIADSPIVVKPKKNVAVASQPQQNNQAELPTALSTATTTALDNFQKDLASGKMEQDLCFRYLDVKVNPLCKDKYVYHPDANETYSHFQNRYAGVFKPGELRNGGQANQVAGSPNITPIIFPMEFDKADLDKRLGM